MMTNTGEIDFNALRETFQIDNSGNFLQNNHQLLQQFSPQPETPEQTLYPDDYFGFSLAEDTVFQSLSPSTWASVDNFSKVPLVFSTEDDIHDDKLHKENDLMSTSLSNTGASLLQSNIPQIVPNNSTQNHFQQIQTQNVQHQTTVTEQTLSTQMDSNQRSNYQHAQSTQYNMQKQINHGKKTNSNNNFNQTQHNWNYSENVMTDSQVELTQLRYRNTELEQKLNTVYELYLHQDQKLNIIMQKLDTITTQHPNN